jgi:hypothetical protein
MVFFVNFPIFFSFFCSSSPATPSTSSHPRLLAPFPAYRWQDRCGQAPAIPCPYELLLKVICRLDQKDAIFCVIPSYIITGSSPTYRDPENVRNILFIEHLIHLINVPSLSIL